jgi:hypothetical protein
VTYLDILQRAEQRGLDIIALTDHNTAFGYACLRKEIDDLAFLERAGRIQPEEIEVLEEYRRLLGKILLLPGFELTAGQGIHILALFPDDTPLRLLDHLLLRFGVPLDLLDDGVADIDRLADAATVCRVVDEAGGVTIAAHANLAHGLLTIDPGRQQEPRVHALEMAEQREGRGRGPSAQRRQELIRRSRLVQSSNAHRLSRQEGDRGDGNGVGDRTFEIQLEELSFEALRWVFRGDNFSLTRAYQPGLVARPQQDPILAARQRGPGVSLAFHDFQQSRADQLIAVIEDIAAMANTRGGAILVGVGDDPRAPIPGLADAAELAEAIRREVEEVVEPAPEIESDVRTVGGRQVLWIEVAEGREAPYVVDGERVLVRQRDESVDASEEEVEELRHKVVSEARERPFEPPEELSARASPSGRGGRGHVPEPSVEPVEQPPLPGEEAEFSVPPPATGAEIVGVEEREGVRYYAIRDLRNGNIVRNVTRFSARHLWYYAISEREEHAFDPDEVEWDGDLGIWHAYTRRGVRRYNLVQRDTEDGLHVYYGVTEDGLADEWRALLPEPATPVEELED